ncbi:MAG: type II toxin-antitoxin system RelE/ParE family toxin [Oscillospiraceae bacterium]
MAFEIEITDAASEDLDSIFRYIAIELDNVFAARHLVVEIEHRYDLLIEQPFLYPLSQSPRLAEKGYRKAVICNFLMLYRVDEEKRKVYIINFYYGGQNYEKYI